MNDTANRVALIAAIVAGGTAFFWGIGWLIRYDNERTEATCKEIHRMKNEIMGKPFTMNGKKYIAVRRSEWDGTIECITADGPQTWMDPEAVGALIALEVKP
jgi:hypothetical protein